MRKAAIYLIALVVVSVGAVAAVSLDWGGGQTREQEPEIAHAAQAQAEQAAIEAVQTHLRGLPGGGELTAIMARAMGADGEYAVCAKLAGTNGAPVVARVIAGTGLLMVRPDARQANQPSRHMVVLEDGPGLWRGGAAGVPWQRYCDPSQQAEPAPDVAPTELLQPVVAQQPVVPPGGAPPIAHAAESGSGSVTVISPVRVRAAPNGQAEVLWVAPRGRSLSVHGHAPGGWVQVGDGAEATGWAHSSLLGPGP